MADRYSEMARGLEPYILRYINRVVGDQQATAVQAGVNLNKILLMDLSIGDYNEFAITNSGFSSALSSAASGDVIIIPPCSISGDHTITDGVKVVGLSRWATILTGQITGGNGASIETLSIERSANDATTLIGVDSPASGTLYIRDCDIEADQSGSGDARGISADLNGTFIECWGCYLYGNSGSGTGYAAYRDTGTSAGLYIFGGRAEGSTAEFNV